MPTVGERIKKRRKELKLSADYVAEKLGKNRATIYRYESDEIEDMSINVISDISKVLKVSPAYLMGWTDSKEDLYSVHEYTYFDEPISAGKPIAVDAVTNAEKIKIPDVIMGKWAGSKDIYITRVNGSSMDRVIPDGSLIAVKPTELSRLKNEDIVVYKYDNEYAVKRFYDQGDKIVFKPDSYDNSFYDQVIPKDCELELKIKGKVVLYIVELDK